jgi:hypothetical protein
VNYTRQVVTRVTEPEDDFLRRRAERENSSIATVIRCLVQDAIRAEQHQQHSAAA